MTKTIVKRITILTMVMIITVVSMCSAKSKLGYIIVDTQAADYDMDNVDLELVNFLNYEFGEKYDIERANRFLFDYLAHLYGHSYPTSKISPNETKYYNADPPYDFDDFVGKENKKLGYPYDLLLVLELNVYAEAIDFKSHYGGSRTIYDLGIDPIITVRNAYIGYVLYSQCPKATSSGTYRHKIDYVMSYALRDAFGQLSQTRFIKQYNLYSNIDNYLDYANAHGNIYINYDENL